MNEVLLFAEEGNKDQKVDLLRFTIMDPEFKPGQSGSSVCNYCLILPLELRKVFLF